MVKNSSWSLYPRSFIKAFGFCHVRFIIFLFVIAVATVQYLQASEQRTALQEFKFTYYHTGPWFERDETLIVDSRSGSVWYEISEADYIPGVEFRRPKFFYSPPFQDIAALQKVLNKIDWMHPLSSEIDGIMPDSEVTIIELEVNSHRYRKTFGGMLPPALEEPFMRVSKIIALRRNYPRRYDDHAFHVRLGDIQGWEKKETWKGAFLPVIFSTSDLKGPAPLGNPMWPSVSDKWVKLKTDAHPEAPGTTEDVGGGAQTFFIDYSFLPEERFASLSLQFLLQHDQGFVEVPQARPRYGMAAWKHAAFPLGRSVYHAVFFKRGRYVFAVFSKESAVPESLVDLVAKRISQYAP